MEDELSSDGEGVAPLDDSETSNNTASRIVFIGHLPYGLFELQLKEFLKQFGSVTNVVVPRSKKTNRYKGYGFASFESPEVAEIVKDTLHNHMLLGKRLVCSLVEPERMDYDSFLNSKSNYVDLPIAFKKSIKRAIDFAKQINKPKDDTQEAKRRERLNKKDSKKRAQLESMGINYSFPGYLPEKSESTSPKEDDTTQNNEVPTTKKKRALKTSKKSSGNNNNNNNNNNGITTKTTNAHKRKDLTPASKQNSTTAAVLKQKDETTPTQKKDKDPPPQQTDEVATSAHKTEQKAAKAAKALPTKKQKTQTSKTLINKKRKLQ